MNELPTTLSAEVSRRVYQAIKDGVLKHEDIEELIRYSVQNTLLSAPCAGSCPVQEQYKDNIMPTIAVFETIGKGDIKKGIQVMRANHEFVVEFRHNLIKVRNRIGNMFLGAFFVAVMGGTAYVFKDFIIRLFSGGK